MKYFDLQSLFKQNNCHLNHLFHNKFQSKDAHVNCILWTPLLCVFVKSKMIFSTIRFFKEFLERMTYLCHVISSASLVCRGKILGRFSDFEECSTSRSGVVVRLFIKKSYPSQQAEADF